MSAQHAALLETCLREAALEGKPMMARWVASAEQVVEQLAEQKSAATSIPASHTERLQQSMVLLRRLGQGLGERFPAHLNRAFTAKSSPTSAPSSSSAAAVLRYDQLEQLSEAQIEEKTEIARVLALIEAQVAPDLQNLLACLHSLRLNPPIDAPERNPLRPLVYIEALIELFKQSEVGAEVRVDWLQCMGQEIARSLNQEYARWSAFLKSGGMSPGPFGIPFPVSFSTPAPVITGSPAPLQPDISLPLWSGQSRHSAGLGLLPHTETRLTVKQLRRLVMGEFDMRRYGDEGDPYQVPASGDRRQHGLAFEHTVPAALETLEEMRRVDDAMQRLVDRGAADLPPAARFARGAALAPGRSSAALAEELAPLSASDLYARLRQSSHSIGHILGLEVVALMIANIVADTRLHASVRDLVARLESPLLRLVLVDQRFFNDKTHPARRLLDAVVSRSAVYSATDDPQDNPGLATFLAPLREAVEALMQIPMESAEPFQLALDVLEPLWAQSQQIERNQHAVAVKALLHAEQRNRDAAVLAQALLPGPGAGDVPESVLAFVTGPWAQVVAQVRLQAEMVKDQVPSVATRLSKQADDYTALVQDLYWSVCPDKVGIDSDRLLRLIPSMLNNLRAGLKTIDYPAKPSSEFFDKLITLHQACLQKSTPAARRSGWGGLAPADPVPQARAEHAASKPKIEPTLPWLAPREVQSSGYLEDVGIDFSSVEAPLSEPMVFDESVFASSQLLGMEDPVVSEPQSKPSSAASSSTYSPSSSPRTSTKAPDINALVAMAMDPSMNATTLRQGQWVNMLRGGAATRAELIWVSPEQTLYMFTTASGRNQSMSRGTLDRLIQQGHVQLLVPASVVDNALNAVTQTALRNSLEADDLEDSPANGSVDRSVDEPTDGPLADTPPE